MCIEGAGPETIMIPNDRKYKVYSFLVHSEQLELNVTFQTALAKSNCTE